MACLRVDRLLIVAATAVAAFFLYPTSAGASVDAGAISVAVTASLSPTNSSFTYDLSVPRTNADATALVAKPLTQLIAATTDGLSLGDQPLWGVFANSDPTIDTNASSVTVHAKSQLPYDPLGGSLSSVSVSRNRSHATLLTLRLTFAGQHVVSYDPLPSTASGGVATWNAQATWTTIRVQIAPDLLGELRTSTLDTLLPSPLSYLLPSGLVALLLAIPLTWAIWLVVREPRAGRYRLLLVFLALSLGLTLVVPLLDTAGYLASTLCSDGCLGLDRTSEYGTRLGYVAIGLSFGYLVLAALSFAVGLSSGIPSPPSPERSLPVWRWPQRMQWRSQSSRSCLARVKMLWTIGWRWPWWGCLCLCHWHSSPRVSSPGDDRRSGGSPPR